MSARILLVLLSAALLASALSLVTAQHRARGLFIDLEAAQREARRLESEGGRLRVELGRAAQPSVVADAARRIGLESAQAGRTVVVPSTGVALAATSAAQGPVAGASPRAEGAR